MKLHGRAMKGTRLAGAVVMAFGLMAAPGSASAASEAVAAHVTEAAGGPSRAALAAALDAYSRAQRMGAVARTAIDATVRVWGAAGLLPEQGSIWLRRAEEVGVTVCWKQAGLGPGLPKLPWMNLQDSSRRPPRLVSYGSPETRGGLARLKERFSFRHLTKL